MRYVFSCIAAHQLKFLPRTTTQVRGCKTVFYTYMIIWSNLSNVIRKSCYMSHLTFKYSLSHWIIIIWFVLLLFSSFFCVLNINFASLIVSIVWYENGFASLNFSSNDASKQKHGCATFQLLHIPNELNFFYLVRSFFVAKSLICYTNKLLYPQCK